MTTYVDDKPYFTHTPGEGDWTVWPYDRPFHLILNIAVGGNWWTLLPQVPFLATSVKVPGNLEWTL